MEKLMLAPNEIAEATCNAGIAKAKKPVASLLALGILAGMFIAFGAVGATILWAKFAADGMSGWGKFMGAAVFPVGIMLVVMCGSELFTGNNLMTLGCAKGEYGFSRVLRNWGIVYFGNFIGSIFMALLIANSGLYAGIVGEKAMAIASAKVSLPVMEAVARAIMCNMLVVLAIWFSTASKDVIGKIFALWFPIMLFVLSGFEHSIANMFFIPVGMFMGANVTWGQIWINNLLPVTIGNIIGGGIIIPVLYYFVFIKSVKEAKK